MFSPRLVAGHSRSYRQSEIVVGLRNGALVAAVQMVARSGDPGIIHKSSFLQAGGKRWSQN